MNPFIIFFSLFLHGGQRYPYHGSAACLLIFHFRPQSIQVSYRFSMRRAGERESDVLLLPAFLRFFLPLPHSSEICGFRSHSVLRGPGAPRSVGMFCTFCSMCHLLFCRSFFHRSKSACTAGSSNIRLMQPISVLHMASDWWAGMASASICTVFGVLVSTLFNAAPPFWWFFFPLLPLPDILISSILAG